MTTIPNLYTVNQLRDFANMLGSPYFAPDTMRFFNSRVLSGLTRATVNGEVAYFFVTSERFDSATPRYYSIRRVMMGADGRLDFETMNEFNEHKTAGAARRALVAIVAEVSK